MNLMRDFFAGVFVIISGFSCNLSNSNLKRGLRCFGVGLILSLVTYLVSDSVFIAWGILHMLGFCMISFGLTKRFIKKINNKFLALASLVLFFITFNIPRGYLGFNGVMMRLPRVLYDNKFLFALGFPDIGFRSADYFPVIPWAFLFLFGAAVGSLDKIYQLKFIYKRRSKFLSFCGKKTLIIYIFHQPVFLFIAWSVSLIFSNFFC